MCVLLLGDYDRLVVAISGRGLTEYSLPIPSEISASTPSANYVAIATAIINIVTGSTVVTIATTTTIVIINNNINNNNDNNRNNHALKWSELLTSPSEEHEV